MEDSPVALVTGGTKGIGYSIVQELLKSGKRVICCSRKKPEDLNQQFLLLQSKESLLDYVTCDTTNEQDVKELFSYISTKYRRLDVLVNNVGGSLKKPLLALSKEEIRSMIDTNLLSTIYCTKNAVKLMMMQRKGNIINISSIAGTNGLPLESIYCAAKAGIIGFTKAIAKEYGGKGIQCNAVVAGIIQTETANKEVPQNVVETIPQKRTGTTLDVAKVVNFLASENAAYITGQEIKVDGGLYI